MNPLDQLADISAPSEVSIWPLAWGYWAAIALFIVLVFVSVSLIYRHLKRTQQKRKALAQLNQLDCADLDYIPKAQVLLKQVCAAYFPAHRVKTMHGGAWEQFVLAVYAGKNEQLIHEAMNQIHQHLYSATVRQQEDAKVDIAKASQQHLKLKSALLDFIQSSFPAKKNAEINLANVKELSKSNKGNDEHPLKHDKKQELAHV